MDKILIFIPCYNCEKQIIRVLSQLNENILNYIDEVIVVNNLSTDKTEEAVISFASNNPSLPIKLLRNNKNYNLGGSHKVAFSFAMQYGFDYVIVLHGDDQGDIKDIIPYIKNGTFKNFDSILGSRFEKDSILKNYSSFRIIGNHIFNYVLSMVAGRRITDLGSGLNMYKTKYLSNRFYMGFPNSLTFNVYMLLYGVSSSSKFLFFPLTWREDDQISNAKLVRQSKEILSLTIKYFFNKRKLFSGEKNQYSEIDYGYHVVYENLSNKGD